MAESRKEKERRDEIAEYERLKRMFEQAPDDPQHEIAEYERLKRMFEQAPDDPQPDPPPPPDNRAEELSTRASLSGVSPDELRKATEGDGGSGDIKEVVDQLKLISAKLDVLPSQILAELQNG